MSRINNQIVALVTGGNRGIGKEICRQLAESGHIVFLCSRNTMKGEKAAASITGDVRVKKLDVTDESAVRSLAEQITEEVGYIDVLINNAGVIKGEPGVTGSEMSLAKSTFNTNLFGAWNMVHYFLPLLKKSHDPRIINISSGMGAWADLSGGHAPYRISKTALNAFSLLLSNEFAGNIKVNAMCPGWVKTDMGGSNATRDVDKGAETAVWLSTASEIPHGKFLRDMKEIEW